MKAPDPSATSSASLIDSNGEGAQRAGRLPTGRVRIFGACALLAFIATVGAYLQPVREDSLQPMAAWQWGLYPIERNGIFRSSDTELRLNNVFLQPDGETAWLVGKAGSAERTNAVILQSGDGGESWDSVFDQTEAGQAAGSAPTQTFSQAVTTPEPSATPDTAPTQDDSKAEPAQIQAQMELKQALDAGSAKGDGSGIPNAAAQTAQQQTAAASPKDDASNAAQAPVQDPLETAPSPDAARGSGLNSIAMLPDGKRGWAVGDDGLILRTEDGGTTWTPDESITRADLLDVAFSQEGAIGWVVGDDGTILLENPGNGWVAPTSPTRERIGSLAILPDGRATALAIDCTLIPLPALQAVTVWKEPGCYKVAALGNGGDFVVAAGSTLFRVSREGMFQAAVVPVTGDAIESAAFSADGQTGWISTLHGRILSSADAGATWQERYKQGSDRINRIATDNSGRRVLALGAAGIVSSGDGGETWHQPEYRRYPAPWLYGSWLCIFAAGFLSVRREEKALEDQLDEAVAPEIEADAPARRLADDRLAFKPVIETLAKFLRNTGTKPPLTITIDGEWGSGKTSMMRMLQGELRSLGFPTVWFNPWHHQKEDVMLAALVQHIRTEGLPFLLHPRGLRFRQRLILGRIRTRPFCTALIVMGLLTPVLYFLRHQLDDPVDYFRHIITPAVDLLAALIPPRPDSVGKITESLTNPGLWLTVSFVIASFFLVNGLRAFPLSPAALLATINSKFSTQSAENQTDYRRRFGDTFAMVTAALSPRPMVIFIDDLDRCLPEKALETLEATNYLASSGQCFIVLGMARTRVERLIGLASEKLAAEMADSEGSESRRVQKEADLQRELRRSYARRYLEKLVQLNVRVPSSDAKNLMSLLNAEANAAEAAKRPDPLRLLRRGWTLGGFLVVLGAAAACAYALAAFNWPALETPAPTLVQTEPANPAAAPSSNPVDTVGTTLTPSTPTTQVSAAPEATGSGIAYWPIALLVGVFVYLLYRMNLTEEAPINETPYYLRAIADWNGVVVSRQRSPRSVKLFGNLARYSAMMLLEPEQRHKLVARPKPLLGSNRAKPPEPGAVVPPVEPPSRARERDCVAVALASIYHVRPDILDGGSSILGADWEAVLAAVRDGDELRYRQRLIEMQALLESRATGQAANGGAAPLPPRDDEVASAERQVLADPELREELLRLRSRRDAVEVIAETLARLPDYYGAWPPSEEILQRFRLFVMGSVQVERSEESPTAPPTSASA